MGPRAERSVPTDAAYPRRAMQQLSVNVPTSSLCLSVQSAAHP
jgi:hypothetical protein